MVSNPNNPLVDFKSRTGISWREMAEKIGISVTHLQRLMSYNKTNITGIKYSTYLQIRNKIGVDLKSYIEE